MTGLYVAIAIVTIGFVVCALWALIDWGELLRRKFANNAAKGRVYIDEGEDWTPINCKRFRESDKGEFYKWKEGKKEKVIILPKNYPVKFVRGRRSIFMRNGDVVAPPMIYGDQDYKPVDGPVLAALVMSGVITDLVMSLTAKKGIPMWVWLVLGVGVVVVIYFVMQHMGTGATPPASPVEPPPPGI